MKPHNARMKYARTHLALLLCCAGPCLSALTGCGTEIVKEEQVQNTLAAAQQQAQIGRTQEARRWADRAIAIAPRAIGTYITASSTGDDAAPLGIADAGDGEHGVFTSVGDDASVVLYMTQAANKFPNNPLPLLILEQAQGRLGDAAAQHTTAARLAALVETQLSKPGHAISADLINTLAQAYWDAGNPVKGAADFRRVIATYPHDPGVINAYNGLAYEYALTDDTAHLTEAVTLAKTALSLTDKLGVPGDARDSLSGAIQDTLGWVQYRQGDYKDALVNIEKGVGSNPRLAEGRYHLAMVYKALGNIDAARIELGYAVKLSQGYAAARGELERLPASTPKEASSPSG